MTMMMMMFRTAGRLSPKPRRHPVPAAAFASSTEIIDRQILRVRTAAERFAQLKQSEVDHIFVRVAHEANKQVRRRVRQLLCVARVL